MSGCDDGPNTATRKDHRRCSAATVTIQILRADDAVRTMHARWPARAGSGTATTACAEPAAQRQAESTSASPATSGGAVSNERSRDRQTLWRYTQQLRSSSNT